MKNQMFDFKISDILRHAIGSATITNVDTASCKIVRYLRNLHRFLPKGVSEQYLVHSNLIACGNTYTVYVFSDASLKEWPIHEVFKNMQIFVSVQGVTKTLLTAITTKSQHYYGKMLKRMANTYSIHNVIILMIKRKLRRKTISYRYKIVQFNPFKNILRIGTCKAGKKIFPDIVENLHNRKIIISTVLKRNIKRGWSMNMNDHASALM